MPLTLRIENMDSLPDGGPVTIGVDRRGIAIGRDAHLDWTLPDPQRFISGTHCEVQFRDGGYWLHDRSSNGTHVNDNPQRMTEAHLLTSGDRIGIGQFIITVEVTGEEASAAAAPAGAGGAYGGGDVWGGIDDAAEPGNRQDFRMGPSGADPSKRQSAPVQGDALEDANWGMERAQESPGRAPPNKLPPLAGSEAPPGAPDIDAGAFDVAAPAPAPASNAAPGAPPGDLWGAPEPAAPPSRPAAAPGGEAELSLGAAQERAPAEPADDTLSLGAAAERPAAPPDSAPQAKASGLAAKWTDSPKEDAAPAAPSAGGGGGDVLAAFARGAGIPADAIGQSDPDAFVEEVGRLFRVTCDNLKAMLKARDETKGAMRSADRTMIGAIQNNPLKSLPTTEDAIKVMLGPATESYLGALAALERGFHDLQDHQMRVFGAMQQALGALIEDMSPDGIAETAPGDGGLAKLVSSRRAKLWDIYVERYNAKASRHERGMIDAFMLLFAEMYDAQKPG